MPEISRFIGIVIRMYFQDHEPPPFHAAYGGAQARVRISPIGLLDGDIPPRPLALTMEWATLHAAELLENWSRLRLRQPPIKIAPLE
jgi:hypothetical protein